MNNKKRGTRAMQATAMPSKTIRLTHSRVVPPKSFGRRGNR